MKRKLKKLYTIGYWNVVKLSIMCGYIALGVRFIYEGEITGAVFTLLLGLEFLAEFIIELKYDKNPYDRTGTTY